MGRKNRMKAERRARSQQAPGAPAPQQPATATQPSAATQHTAPAAAAAPTWPSPVPGQEGGIEAGVSFLAHLNALDARGLNQGSFLDDPVSKDVYSYLFAACEPLYRATDSQEQCKWDLHRVQGKAQKLMGKGEHREAHPWLCLAAIRAMHELGCDEAATVAAVWEVAKNMQQRGISAVRVYTWLLPRAVRVWGIHHPNIRQMVHQSAVLSLWQAGEPGHNIAYTQVVTEVAQQLPGGPGWGSTVVAPVPDMEAYDRHVMLQEQARAMETRTDRATQLATQMLTQCMAFYESMGPHWLACGRKAKCKLMASFFAEPERRLEAVREAKRLAESELGREHPVSLEAMFTYGLALVSFNRSEQGLSYLTKAMLQREEIMGRGNYLLLADKVGLMPCYTYTRTYLYL